MKEYKNGYNSGGYEWCSRNWGTKWGLCHTELNVDIGEKRSKFDDNEELKGKNQLVYTFDTAWSPATPIIMKMTKLFPKLTFIWYCDEESQAFRFQRQLSNGELVSHEDIPYEDGEEEI